MQRKVCFGVLVVTQMWLFLLALCHPARAEYSCLSIEPSSNIALSGNLDSLADIISIASIPVASV